MVLEMEIINNIKDMMGNNRIKEDLNYQTDQINNKTIQFHIITLSSN